MKNNHYSSFFTGFNLWIRLIAKIKIISSKIILALLLIISLNQQAVSQPLFNACYDYCSNWPNSSGGILFSANPLTGKFVELRSNNKIYKCNNNGQVSWVKQYPSTMIDTISNGLDTIVSINYEPLNIEMKDDDSFYISGKYDSSYMVISNGNIISTFHTLGIYFADIDSSGNSVQTIIYKGTTDLNLKPLFCKTKQCWYEIGTLMDSLNQKVAGNNWQWALSKMDLNGSVLFSKVYSIPHSFILLNSAVNDSGQVFLLMNDTLYNRYLIKIDDNGNMLWTKMIPILNNLANVKLIASPDGNVYALERLANNSNYRSIIIAFDQFGNINWSKQYSYNYDIERGSELYLEGTSPILFFNNTSPLFYYQGAMRDTSKYLVCKLNPMGSILNSIIFNIGNSYQNVTGFSFGGSRVTKTKKIGDLYYVRKQEYSGNSHTGPPFTSYSKTYSMDLNYNSCVFMQQAVNVYDSVFNLSSVSLSNYSDSNFTIFSTIGNVTLDSTSMGSTVLCNSSVGINETEIISNDIIVYPNPSPGVLTVKLAFQQDFEISVFNSLGSCLLKRKYNNCSEASIDLSKQPKGIYLFKINNITEDWSKKIILN